ncbi:MAG TPA: type II CAAX endopeptidase family protein [Rhizomicrobium sp.]|jgi:membrane protease YdiL (CAAX protease family)
MTTLQHFLATTTPFDLALLAFAALVMPAMSILAGRQLSRAEKGSLVPRYIFTMARGLGAAAVLLIGWYWLKRPFAALGLDIPVGFRGQIGFAVDAVLVAVFAFNVSRVGRLSGEALQRTRRAVGQVKILPRTAGELAAFLAVALNAGFWEELFYRGFLIWLFTPVLGVIGAVALSSALFGIGHAYQGWRGVLMTGVVGLVFAVAYVLTNSLWWLMLAHALIDFQGGIAGFWLQKKLARSPSPEAVG